MICQASDKLILNDIGNLVKRSLHLHSADIVSLHRHAVNYAGRLVLPYRERSGLPHFKQTVRAVPATTEAASPAVTTTLSSSRT